MTEKEYESHRTIVNRYEAVKSEYNSLILEKEKIQNDRFGVIIGGYSTTDSPRKFDYRKNIQQALLNFCDSQIELAKADMEELQWEVQK